ncbi:DDHD domain protein, partial [Opisthorchis viverrini]
MRPNLSKSVTGQTTQLYSGLTMSINRATLPSVPFFVPPNQTPTASEGVSSFVGQDDPAVETNSSATISSASLSGAPLPPIEMPPSHGSATRSGPRSRYVLPPGIQTTHSAVEPVVPSLPPPTHLPMTGTQVSPGLPHPNEPISPPTSMAFVSEPHANQATFTGLPACQPVTATWFYATVVNQSRIWWPFSRYDNSRIEAEAFSSFSCASPSSSETLVTADESKDDIVVPVEGGRYDVYVNRRERRAVYWDEPVTEVRRATWFYRSPNEARVLPFSERMCDLLEVQYKLTLENNLWGQRFELPSEDPRGGTDYFIFHNPQSMIQYRAWPYSSVTAPGASTVITKKTPSSSDDLRPKAISTLSEAEHDSRVCFIRRGLDEQLTQQLEEGEFLPVDHVYFVVHGIGSVHNLRGEGLVECVNGLRRTARQIARSHFPHHDGRAEFIPIMWHDNLHSDATGVDEQLSQITLRSIPKLRQFTNGTLTDILFYTSSRYCQVIVDAVAKDICRFRELFLARNPNYTGGFSIIGHSLGSVIVFDLLAHQRLPSQTIPEVDSAEIPETSSEDNDPDNDHPVEDRTNEEMTTDKSEQSSSTGGETECWSLVGHEDSGKQSLSDLGRPGNGAEVGKLGNDADVNRLIELLVQTGLTENQTSQVIRTWLNEKTKQPRVGRANQTDLTSNNKSVQLPSHSFWLEGSAQSPALAAGFGMPVVIYPQLGFPITAFFMLGSPLPLFLTARGIKQLSTDYHLPTCPMFYNVFHPFDPVAYRMETLVDSTFQPRAVLMPHHKGRKRLHLQLRDNLARVGADLKAKLYQSVQSTWKSLQEFAISHGFFANQTDESDSHGTGDDDEQTNVFKQLLSRLDNQPGERDDAEYPSSETELSFSSQLNQRRRIDFVLQEAPLESFSDYLFALGSHAAYWESEDTALFLLSEVYSLKSVVPVGQKQLESSSVAGECSFIPPTVSQDNCTLPTPSAPHEARPSFPTTQTQSVSFSSVSSPVFTPHFNTSATVPPLYTGISTTYSQPSTFDYSQYSNPSSGSSIAQSVNTTIAQVSPPCPPLPPPPGHLSQQTPKDIRPSYFPAYQHHKTRNTATRPPAALAQLYQPTATERAPTPALQTNLIASQLATSYNSNNPIFPAPLPPDVFPVDPGTSMPHHYSPAAAHFIATTTSDLTFSNPIPSASSMTALMPPTAFPGP